MRYEGNIFRPGLTESNSYLLQVTMGCMHNKCSFCSFYKDKPFKLRPYKEIEEDILMDRKQIGHVPSVFLIDGNVAGMSMERLRPILKKIKEVFPESKYTNMYGTYSDVYRKSIDDLKEMKELGVDCIYAFIESGSDKVLNDIHKGVSYDEAVTGANKLSEAGIGFFANMILGMGGTKDSEVHVNESIRFMNEVKAPFVATTALNPQPGTELYNKILDKTFELPTYRQILEEEERYIKGINPDLSFNLMSGAFLPLNDLIIGNLPEDRNRILEELEMRKSKYKHWLDKKIKLGGSL